MTAQDHTFNVGDVVRVGSGKKLWQIDELWADRPLASLRDADPDATFPARTTVHLDRLVTVRATSAVTP